VPSLLHHPDGLRENFEAGRPSGDKETAEEAARPDRTEGLWDYGHDDGEVVGGGGVAL